MNIKYEQWKRVIVRTGQTKKCTQVELVAQEGTLSEISEILEEQIMPHSSHMFKAKWHQGHLRIAKQTMRPHSAIIIMDFAENYNAHVKMRSSRFTVTKIPQPTTRPWHS